ncbi:MAG TPA: hypothetical protein VF009_09560 [Solirubrobacterales bacterium]
MSRSPQPPRAVELPYRWCEVEGTVRIELRENDDPTSLGCVDFARGFPTCRAKIEPEARGYIEMLGWVQLVEHSLSDRGFYIDGFEPLGSLPHPFGFYGVSPTLFDAPHSPEESWDFIAHSFLCGLGGELLEFRREVRAVLGFSWGFRKRGEEFEYLGPDALAAAAWNGHLEYLRRAFPDWKFVPGFHRRPVGT